MSTGTVDITENGAIRLMAALAAQEIRDFFNGCDNKEDAERSLQLLLQIIAGAVPATPNSEDSCTQSTVTQHSKAGSEGSTKILQHLINAKKLCAEGLSECAISSIDQAAKLLTC